MEVRREADWRTIVAVIVHTLLIILAWHGTLPLDWLTLHLVLFLAAPLAVVVLVFRESPTRYGLVLGDWRLGLPLTGAAGAVMAIVILIALRMPAVRETYTTFPAMPVPQWLGHGLTMFAWEFLFRGFLLFALVRAFGRAGIVLQAVPFALAHLGKSDVEAGASLFGGIVLGALAVRTRSFLYPFLIHWFLLALITRLAAGTAG